ncbi:MAG: penicillin-binding protein 1A [Rhizobiales bacterium]|nr:penicillin-binding protein 1A [Hyphomicrobiales bacterium]
MRFVVRFLGFLFAIGAMVFLVGSAVAGFYLWKNTRDLPDYTQLANYEPPVATRVHAGDGSLIAEYYKERRLYLPIQAVPKMMIAAFLSAEDKNFYTHFGIDIEGIARAGFQLVAGRTDRRQSGASTITQQVAKNFLLTPERTFERKIKEMLIALRIEATYSKDRILELYLNEIYLGAGNYGVAAASLNYFGKSVHELELHELAYIAALPKAPENYSPIKNRDAAVARRNWVIERMVANGYVKKEDGDKAMKMPLGVTFRSLSPNSFAAGYFAEEVRREIADRYGYKKLLEGGLSVRTTLDPAMQVMARKAFVDGLVRFDEARGWRGAQHHLSFGAREWGLALADMPLYTDVQPWRYAVVLDVSAQSARVGLQPRREKSGEIQREREYATLGADGVKWTRKSSVAQVVQPGDVIYVEPLDGKPGQVRLRQQPEVSGALVAMDPWTGRVKAMVGGFSFDQSEFNRATQAMRQPGSSFKPFVYAAALDNGYTPTSIIVDGPIEIDQGNGEVWRPENYGGSMGRGPMPLRSGIEQSRNLMTVRLAQDIGMPLVAEYAKRFGVYDEMLPVLSMSLGAGETTVMRMVTGYSMFANGGRRIKPTLIDRIQDRWGATIFRHDDRQCDGCKADKWENQPEPRLRDNRELVIDPMTAYQITSIMQGVIQRGTATIIKELGRQYLAGKTGTTNEAKDVWFVGFSANLVMGVYLGYDKPRSLGDSSTGGAYAAPIFRDFMRMALKDQPDTPFKIPPGMKLVRVGNYMEAYKPGTGPGDNYVSPGSFGATASSGGSRSVGTGTGGLY